MANARCMPSAARVPQPPALKTNAATAQTNATPTKVYIQVGPTALPVRLQVQSYATPLPIHNADGPDPIAHASLEVGAVALFVAVVTLVAVWRQIFFAKRQIEWAVKDFKISNDSLALQLEAVKPRPVFEFRANGETAALETRVEQPLDIELFLVNVGNGKSMEPLRVEIGIPEPWNITRQVGDGDIRLVGNPQGTIPGYPGGYSQVTRPLSGTLEPDTAGFLGTIGQVYIPRGRWSLLWRVIEGANEHTFHRVVVESH